MKQLFSVAKFTMQQNISNKIFRGFAFFGFFIIMAIVSLKEIAIYESNLVIQDTGLALIEFFVLIMTVYISASQFIKDKNEKSIYLVLTKPVTRGMYITGTAFGIIGVIFLNISVMGIILMLVLLWQKWQFTMWFVYALFYIFAKLSLLAVIGVMFSVLSYSVMSANIFTFCVYTAAHGVTYIKDMADKQVNPLFKAIFEFMYYILPKYNILNYRDILNEKIVELHPGMLVGYVIAYGFIVLILTNFVFAKRKI